MKTRYDKDGYEIVTIYVNGKRKDLKVHRVVAMTFLKKGREDQTQVNHKKGNKKDNRCRSIEWTSSGENNRHAFRIGLKKGQKGETNPSAKYTNSQIETVCSLLESNQYTYDEISKKIDVSVPTIKAIYLGNQWRHISKKYNFKKFDKNTSNKTPDKLIRKICKYLQKTDLSFKEIADKLGTDYKLVWRIYRRECHKDISSKYKFVDRGGKKNE